MEKCTLPRKYCIYNNKYYYLQVEIYVSLFLRSLYYISFYSKSVQNKIDNIL